MMSNGRENIVLPARLARTLDEVRQRLLMIKIAEFPLLLLAFLALAWLFQATADRLLNLSWGVRAFFLTLDLAAALALLWFFVIIPVRKRMDRKKAALFVERSLPQFRTSLISAVELSEKNAEFPAGSHALVVKLLNDTTRQAAKINIVKKVVLTKHLERLAKYTTVACVVSIGIAIYAWKVSPALLQRIFLSQVPIPAATQVISMTRDMSVVAGTDAVLTAKAEGKPATSGRLVIKLSGSKPQIIPVSPLRTENGVFQYTVRNIREPFGYHFEFNDGVGREHRVQVKVPPSIASIKFTQIYPKYTGLKDAEMPASNLRLLQGSKLNIEAAASEVILNAALKIEDLGTTLPLRISGTSGTEFKAEITVPETGWKSLSIPLENTRGGTSVNDPVYRVELIKDRPPLAQITQPRKEAITVVAGAKLPLIFKVSDDFGIKRVALVYQIFRTNVSGTLEMAEKGEIPVNFEATEKSVLRTIEWDLARLVPPVSIGCRISCWIEAEDFAPRPGAGPTRSSEKEIGIISEEQKRMELLEQMGERAKDIERLYDLQKEMNERTNQSIR